MASILVFSEKDELAFELLSWGKATAKKLNLTLAVAFLREAVQPHLNKAQEFFAYGAEKLYLAEHSALRDFNAEIYAAALEQIAKQAAAEMILISSTQRGKELAPRLAQKLGASCVSDALDIKIENGRFLAARSALGGNTVAWELIKTPIKVIAVMPKTFELLPKEERAAQPHFTPVSLSLPQPKVKILERQAKAGAGVNLEEAEKLVCIGRGLNNREDLKLIEALAAVLGAELGCTRDLSHDYHWLPEDRLVGLSGKRCKPRLYLGIGLSGQIQHTVGILGSKLIVAINKDKEAPIFKIADYGIVGDLYEVVPKLTEKLRA